MLAYEPSPSYSLSTNDRRVLAQLLDPESAATAPALLIDDGLPTYESAAPLQELERLQSREASAIQIIEKSTDPHNDVSHDQAYMEALNILDEIIRSHPQYASAYNNRAQLRRWHSRSNASLADPTQAQQLSLAVTDLQTAISLATSPSSFAPSRISSTSAKILAQAWTQLGAIHWATAKSLQVLGLDRIPDSIMNINADWREWDHVRFEEEGSRCFFMAGMYGGKVGRGMAVAANPHARLCGNIVREAMRGETSGKGQESTV